MSSYFNGYYEQLRSSINGYLVPPEKNESAKKNTNYGGESPLNHPWSLPGSLDVEGYDHRKPSNSCNKVKQDMTTCFQNSPCFKEGHPFDSCMASYDEAHVTKQCIEIRKGYAQCRRDLLNRQRIWQRGNRAS